MFNSGRGVRCLIKGLLNLYYSLGVIREVALPPVNEGTVSYIFYEKSEVSHRLSNKKMGTFPVFLDRGATRGRSSGFSCRDQSDQGKLDLVKRLLCGGSQETHRPLFNRTLPPLPVAEINEAVNVEANYNIYIEIEEVNVPVEVEHNTYEIANAYEKIRIYENLRANGDVSAYEKISTYGNTYLTTNTLPVDSVMLDLTSSHNYVNFIPSTPVPVISPEYYNIRGSSFNNTIPRYSSYVRRTNSITISCDQTILIDKLAYTSK